MKHKRNTGVAPRLQTRGGRGDMDARSKMKKKKKTSTREYTEAILVALLAALFLRAFVVQAFRIPTGSMKDTLLVGDFLLVNKFIYGVRTPDGIPYPDPKKRFAGLSYISIPHMRLPEFKDPKNGDVVVFKYPIDESLDYIKRCIAVAGQTIEIRDDEVFIDGKPEGKRLALGRTYDPEEGTYVRYTKITTPYGKSYQIRHSDNKGQTRYLGPLLVPKRGDTITIDADTHEFYRVAIEEYENNEDVRFEDGRLYIQGQQMNSYTFKQGYYFMMGDNRDNSADSREWGLLPADNVVGEALIIYFSWDKWQGLNIFDSIRWSRIAKLIH